MLLKHPGYCLGYRLTCHDRTVCYVTDNELYLRSDSRYDQTFVARLVNFVRGADLLITDTTYRDHEYPTKVDWGHSCVSEVADLAARAKVKRLYLFHHDPDQTDDDIDLKPGLQRGVRCPGGRVQTGTIARARGGDGNAR
jgi:ribonuclease BN (tRNA processing enzyme)